MQNPLEPQAGPGSSKVSLSLPGEMAAFLDAQCRAFGVGRSTYFQMLLDAERDAPRREFVKKARS